MRISPGMKVSIEYTLKGEDHVVLQTNADSVPLTYIHGFRQIIPGLEMALEGMEIGESKQVTVTPDEGYGPVKQEALIEVKKGQVSQDALKAVRVGAYVRGRDASGDVVHARVTEIKDETVVLDLNHPLAGKTLCYEVKVLGIQTGPTD